MDTQMKNSQRKSDTYSAERRENQWLLGEEGRRVNQAVSQKRLSQKGGSHFDQMTL